MAKFEIIMPKLGESIIEATITKWLKSEGDHIEEDDAIVEIATDKVDSEIPSPVEGKLIKLLFEEGDTIEVGKVIALIEIEGDDSAEAELEEAVPAKNEVVKTEEKAEKKKESAPIVATNYTSDRFYSPLVKNIAKEENISLQELDNIQGRGKDGRVTKLDIINHLKNRTSASKSKSTRRTAR